MSGGARRLGVDLSHNAVHAAWRARAANFRYNETVNTAAPAAAGNNPFVLIMIWPSDINMTR